MSLEKIKNFFNEPGRECGPVPFFALNSDLKESELVWALEEMARAGMAGVFLHPRTGLEIDYLSEEFFRKIGLAIETCARLDLKAWLYDEYNWPSGVAGGKLLKAHPEFRQKYLGYVMLKKPGAGKDLKLPGDVVAVFSVGDEIERLEDGFEGDVIRVPRLRNPVLIFYQAECRDRMFVNSCARWVEDERGYLDLMNPEAVKAFISLTHEQYARRFSEHFGKTIPGIFTDEPQHYNGFPWSELFRKRFEAEYGYDPVLRVYLLVIDREDYIRFRVQYYKLAELLMDEGFYRQVSEWCARNNLLLTGHLGMEERISQIAVNHGGIFHHISLMQMPGIDALNAGDGLNGGLGNMEAANFAGKAVSSIGHLKGSNRVLCETGGGAGWQMPLWRFKLMTDWLFGLGINFINPHHSLLSIKGLRKRDFPPSHFWHEPWWDYYPEFSRYVARMSWLLSQGTHQPELGVFVPSSEFKALSRGRGFKDEELKRLSGQIETLCRALLESQRDFEFLFEEAIDEGKVKADDGKVIAGQESYEALIVPGIRVMSKKAMELVLKFVQGGGKAIFLGPLPGFDEDGNETNEWQAQILGLKDRIKIFQDIDSAVCFCLDSLARLYPGVLSLSSGQILRVILHRRKIGDDEIYFLANLELSRVRTQGFLKTAKNGIELLLPFSGEIKRIPFRKKANTISFQLNLEPLESLVLIASDQIAESWVKDTDLVITEFNEDRICGFYPEQKVKLLSHDEIKLECKSKIPPVIPLEGPFSFEPAGPNFYRLGPWKVITTKAKTLPLSSLKEELFFSWQTKALIYFLRPVIGLLNLLLKPESKYQELVYEGFGDLEQAMERFSKISGMALEHKGLYQMLDLLFRFADYLPLRTLFRVYPPAGAYYEAHTKFRLEIEPENLELVWEDLGEDIEIRINGKNVDLKPERVRVWDSENLGMDISSYLRRGKNHLVFCSKMPDFGCLFPSYHTLEPVVLRGEFEVKKNGIIVEMEKTKPAQDLSELGYPHYSGRVKYSAELEIPNEYLDYYLILDCGDVRDQVEVFVNGRSAGKKFGPLYDFPIRELVQPGRNQIDFIVSNTSANLLGKPEKFGLLGPVRVIPFYQFNKSRK